MILFRANDEQIRLALVAVMCLSAASLQLEFTSRRTVPKRLLAALLAGALLAFTLLTASGSLHQALHHNGAADGSSCLVCLFAKGQIDLPQGLPVFAVGVFLLIGVLMIVRIAFPLNFASLLPPGRAPPHFASVS
jgi:hypothetical protein